MRSAFALAFGLSFAAAGSALGDENGIVYSSHGFESPPFVLGQPPVGQDGWAGVSVLSPNAAVIANDLYFSGLQSVRVAGTDLVLQSTAIVQPTNGYYAAIGSYRRTVNFDAGAAGFPIVRVKAVVRIDSPQSPAGNNFFSASVAARAEVVDAHGNFTTTDGVGELAVSSDRHVYGYSGDDNVPGCPTVAMAPCNPPATFLVSHRIKLGTWHKLEVDVDFRNKMFSFVLDGESLPEDGKWFPFPTHTPVNTNVLWRGSLIAYAAPDTDVLQKANYTAHFDNFAIKTGEGEEMAKIK